MKTFTCICERCWNAVELPLYLKPKDIVLQTCKRCRTPEEEQDRQKFLAKWKTAENRG